MYATMHLSNHNIGVIFATGLFEYIPTKNLKTWISDAAKAGVEDIITKETVTLRGEGEHYDEDDLIFVR